MSAESRRGQKRELALWLQVIVSYQCGNWESNTDPFQGQQVTLATEPSANPLVTVLKNGWFFCFVLFVSSIQGLFVALGDVLELTL